MLQNSSFMRATHLEKAGFYTPRGVKNGTVNRIYLRKDVWSDGCAYIEEAEQKLRS